MTELTPEETENPLGGYGKTVAHVIIGLKTTKGTKTLKLDPQIYESIQKEKVCLARNSLTESTLIPVRIRYRWAT